MLPRRQITALLHLLDDPDEEVYEAVSSKLMGFGKEVIPQLEGVWESSGDTVVQERIEGLIHQVHYRDLQEAFGAWCAEENGDILKGALLVAQYAYPEMDTDVVIAQYDKVRRSLWLEINNYLSPVEQVSVFNNTLFGYHKLQGQELSKRDPKYFFLNYLLQSRQGNAYSIGILYLSLCERLDIPLFALDIPKQFVFAYIDTVETSGPYGAELDFVPNIRFYVDPGNGNIYSQRDIDTYLQRIGGGDRELYFTPLTPRRILWRMMEELSACYKYRKEDDKAREIQALMELLID